MIDGPSPKIFCFTPLASSFSSPTAASALGVRSTSNDAAPKPSANVDRRLIWAIICFLLSGLYDLGKAVPPSTRRRCLVPAVRQGMAGMPSQGVPDLARCLIVILSYEGAVV